MLARIDPAALPEWTEIRVEDGCARVVDTRGPVPSSERRRNALEAGSEDSSRRI